MADANINITFDGAPGLSFVAGEDRSIAVLFRDGNNSNLPIDLTGAFVALSFPGLGQTVVRRTNGPIGLLPRSVALATSTFNLTDHGLCTGDPVTFSPVSASVLPAPLVAGTVYYVAVIDAADFSLADISGNSVVLTSPGTGSFTLTNSGDVVLPSPTTQGIATLNLRALVTQQIVTGQAQTFQVSLVRGGKTRIIVINNGLDVLSQPEP